MSKKAPVSKGKTAEKPKEQTEEETKQVTPVTEETPTSPAEKGAKPEDSLVVISELPTKNAKKSPVNFIDNDKKVVDWYNSLNGGQTFTMKQAAKALGISVEELNNSFVRLQKTLLPETLGHITDYK